MGRILDNLDAVCAATLKRIYKNVDRVANGEPPRKHRTIAAFSVKCRRCKRPLSDPKSLASGMGHTCREREEREAA